MLIARFLSLFYVRCIEIDGNSSDMNPNTTVNALLLMTIFFLFSSHFSFAVIIFCSKKPFQVFFFAWKSVTNFVNILLSRGRDALIWFDCHCQKSHKIIIYSPADDRRMNKRKLTGLPCIVFVCVIHFALHSVHLRLVLIENGRTLKTSCYQNETVGATSIACGTHFNCLYTFDDGDDVCCA